MPDKSTTGTYMLSPEHTEAVARAASDPAIAAIIGVSPEEFIARQVAGRTEGTGYGLAIMDRRELVGVCTLQEILDAEGPEMGFWVDQTQRRKGYATFGVGMILEFAFRNLALKRVRAAVAKENDAARRVLEKNGFVPMGAQSGEATTVYGVTRQAWVDFRNGPALAALHPSLKSILTAELEAGNEVVETGGGWPDPDSVFVRLRDQFRTRSSPLPEGVAYTEPNDPHWWRADYTTRSPRHVLAC
jgi:RimJ/RimL family protein N-acetyltransferase